MRRLIYVIYTLLLACVIGGCSSQSSDESHSRSADKISPKIATEELNKSEQSMDSSEKIAGEEEKPANSKIVNDRMVIYTANLSIEVSSYKKTLSFIQKELEKTDGYIVESNAYSVGKDDSVEGTITVRIPQEGFHTFLQSVESGSTKVLNRSISGQDVTEEFVDLDSRLKSKQVVERRLLEFMEKAEKTEDLLNISSDLAAIQEEIEQIKGRMNFLDNQVSLATVTLHVREDKINVPRLDNEDLNTWDRTKKQFVESVNFVLKAVSAVIVFFVGSLPILTILGGILLIMIVIRKKQRKHNKGNPPGNIEE